MPTLRLPADPDLEQLRNQAKALQRQVRAADPDAIALVRELHPRLGAMAAAAPEAAAFARADAQLVTARRYGFASWPQLRRYLDAVATYSRAPHRQPADGPVGAGAGDRADELLRLGCLSYGADEPSRRERARALLDAEPQLAGASIHTIAAVGDVAAAAAALERDPGLARTEGGPFNWEPLLYLAYSRLDSTRPGHSTQEVARLLLVHGADPNAGYLWAGLPSPFTALTGAFGGGEGGQPPHQYALDLARLLLDAGADPNDSQALYNCGLGRDGADDDAHLHLLLEFGLGRGTGGPWHARLAPAHPTPAQLLQDELLSAAARGGGATVRILLAHGVDVAGRGTAHPIFGDHDAYELAVLRGHEEIADLLAAAGAAADRGAADPVLAVLGACMRGDRATVRRLVDADPSLAAAAVAREPDLIVAAAEAGRVDAVALLVELGADVNVIRRAGARDTALHEAAWAGNLPVVRLLLDLGADPTRRDLNYQSTPEGWAEHNGQREVAAYLAVWRA